MELSEFQYYLKTIKRKVPTFDELIVDSAYLDLVVLTKELERVQEEVIQINPFENDERDRIFLRYKLAFTLLKSLFIFADIFISLLISQSTNKLGSSLNKFLKNPCVPLLNLSTDMILPAYCVVIYRNKVIAHHDFQRSDAYFISPTNNEIRLFPFIAQNRVLSSDNTIIENLKNKYIDSIENLRNEKNYPEILRILFHGIPIGGFGKEINKDRVVINRIAEVGRCRSLSSNEILSAVDKFFLAIIDVV